MSLKIGDTAPDFEARHDRGPDQLPRLDRRRLGRALLAPEGLHPGLHHRARLHGAGEARVRRAAASRSSASRSTRSTSTKTGSADIAETQGTAPNYPLIADADFAISKLYGMLPAETEGDPADRTAGRQPDRPQRGRRRARQEGEADPRSIR